jgi:hypothetical protein
MTAAAPSPLSTAQPTFGELFTPKLVTILREGYGLKDLRADAAALAQIKSSPKTSPRTSPRTSP